MRRTIPLGVVGAAVLLIVSAPSHAEETAAPSEAQAAPAASVRSGFTLELGLGAGLTMISPDEGDSSSEFGLAGLSIGIGGFINPQLALMARITGTTFQQDLLGDSYQFTNSLFMAAAQYWFNDQLFVSGGAGVALSGPSPFEDLNGLEVDTETGFGFSLRGGYSFFNSGQHSLRAALELTPAFYDGAQVIGTGLQFEWQWL